MEKQTATLLASYRRTVGWLVFLALMAIVAYLLTNGHAIHVVSALPFLIILACPLMMFFMMKGTNSGGRGAGTTKK